VVPGAGERQRRLLQQRPRRLVPLWVAVADLVVDADQRAAVVRQGRGERVVAGCLRRLGRLRIRVRPCRAEAEAPLKFDRPTLTIPFMKPLALFTFVTLLALAGSARAQDVKRDIPYAGEKDDKRTLDVYAPAGAKDLPVVFWIHGGGWQAGDKSDVKLKPQWFMDKGFVFVSVNYRLLPAVDMGTLIRDVAKSFRWVEDHVGEYGGDPKRVLVGGHSAGAQLAAIICTDERYLKEQGVSFDVLKGCVPVDGDTYDVPAIIEVAETRWRVHHMPPNKFGHREKFGNDPVKHRDFSAVNHVASGKGIPPFLILHVANHPDTSAQAFRLGAVLKEAGVPARVFGAKDTEHSKLNDDLGLPDDPATKALAEFVAQTVKK
jgi:acetyl esterase/lipase